MNGLGKSISELTALEIRDHLLSGQETVEEFTVKLGQFVDAADTSIQAFAHRDDRVVALQADNLQRDRSAGQLPGSLYGVPIGIKDIIDTVDFPTEYGSPIHQGRYSVSDATVVSRLRAAGAVIFGKTVSTEFATTEPGTLVIRTTLRTRLVVHRVDRQRLWRQVWCLWHWAHKPTAR
jgi:Asp-tRNA(Asn)/Glu-tRNA(Gln) amidotransferase A subunit family amidase